MADDPKQYGIYAGKQLDLFKEQSVTAITSMATLSSTATEFGYPKIAQAAERVTYTFITEIYHNTTINISESTGRDLEARVTALEKTVAEELPRKPADPEPRTHEFRCLKDFEDCKRRNPDGHKLCYAMLVACVGTNAAKALTGGGG